MIASASFVVGRILEVLLQTLRADLCLSLLLVV